MESEAKIRRMFHVQNLTIAEIVRQTGLARNTVRRVIRSESAGKTYKRATQPLPVLGIFKETIESWLDADHKLSKKERRSAMKYFTQLQEQGYCGSYDNVQRFVKSWRRTNKESARAYIPQYFQPGEAYQFDWSEEIVQIGGAVQKVKVAQFRLSYSRKFFIAAYIRETQEMLFYAHNLAFKFFGGLTTRGIYDNMKTAVDIVVKGKERVFNKRFLSLMDHYLIEPTACNPASGWEKGQIENQVDNVRDWIFKPRLKFDTLAALNDYLCQRCQEIAANRFHPTEKEHKVEAIYQIEKPHLRALIQAYDGYKEVVALVNSTCLIQFDRNRYSVDCFYANQMVTLRVYANSIEIFSNETFITKHMRVFGRNQTVFDPWHYLPLLERKPGALRNGEPFQNWQLPRAILQVKNILMKRKGGDKECAEILLTMTEHGIEAVNVACELAITENTVNRDYIINTLHRLRQTSIPQPLDISDKLQLKQEPTNNCHQYNFLIPGAMNAIH